MTISNSKIKIYRSSNDIYDLIQVLIDSYLSDFESNTGERHKEIVKKIRSIDIEISQQIMNIFEAPLDKIHFKDLIDQLIITLIRDHVDKAYCLGIISENERNSMNLALEN